jgi:hypothetical protein
MAFKDDSKRKCFKAWLNGLPLKTIQDDSTAKRETVRAWVLDWERGHQGTWTPDIKRSYFARRAQREA